MRCRVTELFSSNTAKDWSRHRGAQCSDGDDRTGTERLSVVVPGTADTEGGIERGSGVVSRRERGSGLEVDKPGLFSEDSLFMLRGSFPRLFGNVQIVNCQMCDHGYTFALIATDRH